jgi:dTDP-4-amino-4,6-dideoxygalactose transaminase
MGTIVSHTATEACVADYAGRAHSVLTSRGATAIYIALKVIGELRGVGEVIVPTVGCLSIPQAVKLSGHTPVFVDVDAATGCLCPEDTEAKITAKTKAIVPIHIFGYAAAISRICSLASKREIAVVEDACHALGGRADGSKIGSWGLFSVASFGGTKSLGGLGGGALLFDDESLMPAIERIRRQLPLWPEKQTLDLLALSHRNLYHGVVDYRRATGLQSDYLNVGKTSEQYRPLLLSSNKVPEDAIAAIESSIADAESIDRRRVDAARAYDRILQGSPCHRPSISRIEETGTVWRYTFTCPSPESAISLTGELRRAGLHASNQFWSLAEIWDGSTEFPGTSYFQERVVNLWVDRAATKEYLDRTEKVVRAWTSHF